jgi:DNA-binding CsgD family transcriptional regulator
VSEPDLPDSRKAWLDRRVSAIYYRIDSDEDARRVSAVLEALGYEPKREALGGATHRGWVVDQLASGGRLTTRERAIVEGILDGRTPEQLGNRLGISRPTVKWHTHNVLIKLQCSSREDVLRKALDLVHVRAE